MYRSVLLTLAFALSVTGCAAFSPSSNLTKLDLKLEGSERLNPDLNGRPSPIVIRLVELKHAVGFEALDFFTLYQRPREALSPDLVALEEIELRPGEQRTLKLFVQDGSRYVGVQAAYRNLPESQWRHVVPLSEQRRTEVALSLTEHGIQNQNDTVGK